MTRMQQLENALVKAHRAGDTRGATAIAAEIKRLRAAPAPKVKPKPKKKSFWEKTKEYGEAALTGVAEGMRPVAEFAEKLNPIDALGDVIEEKIAPGRQAKVKKQKAQQAARMAQRNPNVFTGGKIVGEIAATAPLIALGGTAVSAAGAAPRLAAAAPRAAKAVQRLGQAIVSGGIGTGRTAAQTAAMTTGQRALQAGERVVGGAISGATGAALTDQDVTTGAIFGAGLPVMATVLKRVGGKTIDLLRMPKVKAAQIIREVLGDNVEETRRVLAQLSPDDQRLAQQVLIEAGLEPRAFFGLGKTVTEQVDPDTTARILAQQAAARDARMAGIAGGGDATERRRAAETARRAVSEATGDIRDEALRRANVAGQVVPQAEALASAARQRADEITASKFVPRMRGLEERAAQQAAIMGDMPAIFPDMPLIQQTRGIAGAAGTRANQAMQAQIGLRGVAQDMEDLVADLAAEGMQPLQVAPIVSKILEMAKAPGTRASTLQRRALTKAANQLQALADVNGVIDARDLYQFRKSEIGDIIDVLMSARKQPPSGVKETASGLMTSVKDLIDKAIEGAGGTGWKDYLTRTRQGFEAVNRQELAAKGAQLAKEKPDEFIALMARERPQMVEDIMGKGTRQYDIADLAVTDPQRFNAMMQTAQELYTLNRMRELGTEGSARAHDIMRAQQPGLMERGVGMLLRTKFPALSFATSGTQNVETAIVSPRVRERLAGGYASGNAMRNVTEQYPTAMNVSQAISGMRPITRNVMAQAPARIMQQFPAVDPDTGETLIEIGYNEDGTAYPIYGRTTAR